MKNNPKISSLIDKAIFDFNLIEDGDKILIGASGGKDSTVLIEYFANRAKRKNVNFSFEIVHIKNDFAIELPDSIKNLFNEWNVKFNQINVNMLERIKQNHKMNCYWCSTQRRTELLDFAIKNGFNKIALGHHMDDILETFLMNMLQKGELSTMQVKMQYNKYPITIIRPLCYLSENSIIEYAKEKGFYGFTCTCNYQENSTRKNARQKLELLTDGDIKLKEKMFEGLKKLFT